MGLCDHHKCLTRWVIFAACLLAAGLVFTYVAHAHEHMPGMSKEEHAVVDFLTKWARPSGDFSGIVHRLPLCCYSSGAERDCFRVKEMKFEGGKRWAKPEVVLGDGSEYRGYDHWYEVDKHGVVESQQKDPKESPDGQSYMCIQGSDVVCFVEGGGA